MSASSLHFDADYRETAHLADGSEALLRLVQPEDKPMFVRGLERLSSESRYLRFFTSKKKLTAAELHYLTEIDQWDHFALGAMDPATQSGLGVARFVRLTDDPLTADPAVAVTDDVQGKGLGRLLFVRLVAAARERELEYFRCEVLPQNVAMRQLLRTLDPHAVEQHEDDIVVVRLRLPEVHASDPPERGHGPMYRLLSLAAAGLVQVRRIIRLLRHE